MSPLCATLPWVFLLCWGCCYRENSISQIPLLHIYMYVYIYNIYIYIYIYIYMYIYIYVYITTLLEILIGRTLILLYFLHIISDKYHFELYLWIFWCPWDHKTFVNVSYIPVTLYCIRDIYLYFRYTYLYIYLIYFVYSKYIYIYIYIHMIYFYVYIFLFNKSYTMFVGVLIEISITFILTNSYVIYSFQIIYCVFKIDKWKTIENINSFAIYSF